MQGYKKRGYNMVNIIDNKGKLTRSANTKSSIRQERVIQLIDLSSIDFISGKTKDIIGLQDLKNTLKIEQKENNKPYGMHLIKHHANAQVRTDCLRFRVSGKIEAKQFGTQRVIFYNPKLIQDTIASTKDNKLKQTMIARYKILQDLPKKESYY